MECINQYHIIHTHVTVIYDLMVEISDNLFYLFHFKMLYVSHCKHNMFQEKTKQNQNQKKSTK